MVRHIKIVNAITETKRRKQESAYFARVLWDVLKIKIFLSTEVKKYGQKQPERERRLMRNSLKMVPKIFKDSHENRAAKTIAVFL